MNIYTNHPDYTAFVKNEVDTLTYLSTRGLCKDYTDLTTSIYLAQAEYASKLKKNNLYHFDFHSMFQLEVENAIRHVLIGANVKSDFDECSYFLAITDKDNPKLLIRKFHFDYSKNSHLTKQSVPSFHLQYGGKLSPKMQEDELDDSRLDHWLSIPRLNYCPINLALLLDMMFCEFRTEDTNKIVESSEWRTLIFDNEKFLSKNYFDNIYNHLSSQQYKQTRLLRDFCYGS